MSPHLHTSSAVPIQTGRAVVMALVIALAAVPAGAEEPRLELRRPAGSEAVIEVLDLPASEIERFRSATDARGRTAIFRVAVCRDGQAAQTPMLGASAVDGRLVRFTPRFPLRPGETYEASWTFARGTRLARRFSIPAATQTAPRVVQVFPTGDVLPENQLRFYIHFSTPMRQGGAYAHVELVDADTGKTVRHPFLELGEELWSPSGTRFTLYFDPGRIKRGLQPRELFGPTMVAGHRYQLVVRRSWKAADSGLPLAEEYRRTFHAGPADMQSPDPKRWQIEPVAPGSLDPLRVTLDEPLDHAMLQRVIQVRGPSGRLVPGRVRVEKGETIWVFVPDRSWQSGRYHLIADTTLEDRAGNSIGRPFEVDVFEPVTRRVKGDSIEIPFAVGGATDQANPAQRSDRTP